MPLFEVTGPKFWAPKSRAFGAASIGNGAACVTPIGAVSNVRPSAVEHALYVVALLHAQSRARCAACWLSAMPCAIPHWWRRYGMCSVAACLPLAQVVQAHPCTATVAACVLRSKPLPAMAHTVACAVQAQAHRQRCCLCPPQGRREQQAGGLTREQRIAGACCQVVAACWPVVAGGTQCHQSNPHT